MISASVERGPDAVRWQNYHRRRFSRGSGLRRSKIVFISIWASPVRRCRRTHPTSLSVYSNRETGGEGGGGGGKRRSVLAERPSHMKSAMLRPYASPGGPGFQATVSKRQGHWRLNPEDFSDGGVRGNNAGHHLPAGKITWLSFWHLHKDFIHTRPLPFHADPPPGGVRWEHWHVCWILIRGDRSVSTFKTLARWLKPKQEEFCWARPTLCVLPWPHERCFNVALR